MNDDPIRELVEQIGRSYALAEDAAIMSDELLSGDITAQIQEYLPECRSAEVTVLGDDPDTYRLRAKLHSARFAENIIILMSVSADLLKELPVVAALLKSSMQYEEDERAGA